MLKYYNYQKNNQLACVLFWTTAKYYRGLTFVTNRSDKPIYLGNKS